MSQYGFLFDLDGVIVDTAKYHFLAWKRLADAGFGIWPNAQAVAREQALYASNLPSITWFQQQLALLGYETPQTGELDVATRHVLAAFQMHYRPSRFDGQPDAESAAILQVLNQTK